MPGGRRGALLHQALLHQARALHVHNVTSAGCISWGLHHHELVSLTRCHEESQGSPVGESGAQQQVPSPRAWEGEGLFNTYVTENTSYGMKCFRTQDITFWS